MLNIAMLSHTQYGISFPKITTRTVVSSPGIYSEAGPAGEPASCACDRSTVMWAKGTMSETEVMFCANRGMPGDSGGTCWREEGIKKLQLLLASCVQYLGTTHPEVWSCCEAIWPAWVAPEGPPNTRSLVKTLKSLQTHSKGMDDIM